MYIVFMGPPGAGKGTQAVRLRQHLGVGHLSTGEVLRKARAQGTELGLKAAEDFEAGRLVPDEVVVKLVVDQLTQPEFQHGCLFDGFPRTVAQAEALNELLEERGTPLDIALELYVDPDEILRRLSDRGRVDDEKQTIAERLRQYDLWTRPVLAYYHRLGMLETVEGEGTPDEVFDRIKKVLESYGC